MKFKFIFSAQVRKVLIFKIPTRYPFYMILNVQPRFQQPTQELLSYTH